MASAGYKLGLDGQVLIQTTGTREAWPASGKPLNLSEIDDAGDLSLNIEWSKGELKRRGGKTVLSLAALMSASVEFSILHDNDDAAYDLLIAAAVAGSSVAIAALDGSPDDVGTQGLWADFIVDMAQNQPLEEGIGDTFTFTPAYTGATHVDPEWVTVGS